MPKRLSLIAFVGLTLACTDNHPTTLAGPTPTDPPPTVLAVRTVPTPLVVSGLTGCIQGPELRVGDLSWLVSVPASDLVLATAHSAAPGCAPTTEHPRNPGPLTAAAEGSGTRVRWPERGWGAWSGVACGRVQIDIESRAKGLLVGVVLNYGAACVAPLPPTSVPPVIPPGGPEPDCPTPPHRIGHRH